jgi:hypothetical protein
MVGPEACREDQQDGRALIDYTGDGRATLASARPQQSLGRCTQPGYPCQSMEMLENFHKRIKCGALLNPKTILHFFSFCSDENKSKTANQSNKITTIKGTRPNRARQGPVQPVP